LSILFTSAGSHVTSEYAKAAKTPEFKAAAAAHPDQLKQISGGGSLNDTSFLHGLDKTLAHPFLVGFSDAMDLVFLVGGLLLLLAIALSVKMKEVPLRTMSGQQAARAAAAAGAPDEPVDLSLGTAHDQEPETPAVSTRKVASDQ
jgi:predicted lipid-binding transport protein (Tim44 family)